MNKKCRELLRNNKKKEKEILKSNEEIYKDMIIYLRNSNMTMYNQELVREDLIYMILDGQERGEDIQKVIGPNYKEVCDEIIENMPKKTKLQRAGSILEYSLLTIWLLGIITIVKYAINVLLFGEQSKVISLTVGNIISIAILTLAFNLASNYVTRKAFKKSKQNKSAISFMKWLLLSTLFLGISFIQDNFLKTIISLYSLDKIIITIPLITAIIIVVIVFIMYRLVSNYVN